MTISCITIVYYQNQEIDTGMVVFTKLPSYLDFTRLCMHVFYHMYRFMSPPLSEYRTAPSPQRTTLSPFSSWRLHPPVTLGNHWSVLYHDTLSFQECCINGIIDHFGFLILNCYLEWEHMHVEKELINLTQILLLQNHLKTSSWKSREWMLLD